MDWDAVGAIAEAVGAAGVIATLGYLAVQIRESSATARATMALTAAQSGWDIQRSMAQPDTIGIVANGSRDFQALTREERLQFALLMRTAFNWYEEVYVLRRADRVEADYWAARVATLRGLLNSPGVREWWQRDREQFTPEFRAEVARALGEPASS